jgi:cobalt-zinc-cadmium efflux system membrane fusion protein
VPPTDSRFRVTLRPPALLHLTRAAAALVVAAALALTGCGSADAPHSAAPAAPDGEVILPPGSPKRSAIAVETVQAVTERVIATLPAQVVYDEGHTAHVATPVTGHVVTLDVQPGDRVTAGQPLAHIRSSDASQATSDVAKALTAWHTARTALVRANDLYEHKVIAERDLEQARNDEATAHAEYERARARTGLLGIADGTISDQYVLRAPIGGVVIERLASPGAEVRPDNGQTLFTIASLEDVWLVVGVPQRDLSAVHRGAHIRFTTEALPGQSFDARVSYVSSTLDPVSRTATARAVISNPDGRLRVQTMGSAQILVDDATPSAGVPTRAVITHGSDTVVFVEVAPGRYVRRVVTVRDDDGTTAIIAAGLTPGERVVTTGSLLLSADAEHAQ